MINLKLRNQKEDVLRKQALLQQASVQLKKEFVGIDNVIDQVMHSISGWFCFPDIQTMPTVVNIWGPTGVGKSSVIDRLTHLLMNNIGSYSVDCTNPVTYGDLSNIYEQSCEAPLLIMLDEFQHSRTIDEHGIEQESNQEVWQLLGSGKFKIRKTRKATEKLRDLAKILLELLKKGVEVSKGKVIHKRHIYIKEMAGFDCDQDPDPLNMMENEPLFVPKYFHQFISVPNVRDTLLKMNGREILQFLDKHTQYTYIEETVDCTNSCIIIIGNIDEAYTMHDNLSIDISADEFHRQSMNITVPKIKNALKKRFRSEQIARLGNNHIFYPALSEKSFKTIIEKQLKREADRFHKKTDIKLVFDDSLKEIIYREGVCPMQGTRPVFSTIQYIVNSKLSQITTELITHDLWQTKVRLMFKDNYVVAEYIKEQHVVHVLNMKQALSIEKLRKSKRDNLQAIIATHEAGHAVVSSVLLGIIPEVVVSNSLSDSEGFVYIGDNEKYVSRQEIKNILAVVLAGYAAEEFVFLAENVTTGAKSDLQQATHFILDMLKKQGMGKSIPAFYGKDYIRDTGSLINTEAVDWIREGLQLARDILRKQETLLLKIADYLSDYRVLKRSQIKVMLQTYVQAVDLCKITENSTPFPYREYLKEKVASVSEERYQENTLSLSLNKKI